MSDDLGDLTSRAVQDLAPIWRQLNERLDLTEDETKAVIIAVAQALGAGVRLGASEAVAQMVEAGHEVNLRLELTNFDIRPEDLGF